MSKNTATPPSDARSITFFECWRAEGIDIDADGVPVRVVRGSAGDLAGLLDWLGAGAYPMDMHQVTISRDEAGRFSREAVRIEFPFHRDNWESDDAFAFARNLVESMGESVEAWRAKMDELRRHWDAARL